MIEGCGVTVVVQRSGSYNKVEVCCLVGCLVSRLVAWLAGQLLGWLVRFLCEVAQG